jgi:hypothetical protein
MDISAESTTRCSATLVLRTATCNYRGHVFRVTGVSDVTEVTFSQVKALFLYLTR